MFRWVDPWFALLSLPLLALAVWAWRRRPPALVLSAVAPFQAGAARRRFLLPRWRWPLLLTVAGLLLAIVALMRPQDGIGQVRRHSQGIDIILALDVSGSMDAFDVPESIQTLDGAARAIQGGDLKSRLDVAKVELEAFVRRRPNDRIGLVAFARQPYMVCPPTLDHDFLIGHLRTIKSGMLADGTNLAGPLASAVWRLKDAGSRRRVAVLFTDGVNNVEDRISPPQAAGLAAENAITLYTVGIGSARAVVVAPDLFGRGTVQQIGDQGLDEKLLSSLAAATGGRMFAARDATAFAEVMASIDRLEKVDVEIIRHELYQERFQPWLIAATILLLVGLFLEQSLCQTLP